MYRYIGFGLTGLLFLMVMPSALDAQTNNGLDLYGTAIIVQEDSAGSEVFKQIVHNRLVNTGETFLLGASFSDNTSANDNVQIGTICISDATLIFDETGTAGAFDAADTFASGSNCIGNNQGVNTAGTVGTAIIGPLTFQAVTHIPNAGTVNSIGVCQVFALVTSFTDCGTAGILFASIATSAVTLNTGESVDITYTFDITSPND